MKISKIINFKVNIKIIRITIKMKIEIIVIYKL
jgi:hypothetical protein